MCIAKRVRSFGEPASRYDETGDLVYKAIRFFEFAAEQLSSNDDPNIAFIESCFELGSDLMDNARELLQDITPEEVTSTDTPEELVKTVRELKEAINNIKAESTPGVNPIREFLNTTKEGETIHELKGQIEKIRYMVNAGTQDASLSRHRISPNAKALLGDEAERVIKELNNEDTD
jgi:hypothetical protein